MLGVVGWHPHTPHKESNEKTIEKVTIENPVLKLNN
jgi:hypothetical protein